MKRDEMIKLSFRRSFGGYTAVSFLCDRLCDMYALYEVDHNGIRLIGETEDAVLRLAGVNENGRYLAEGYDVRDGSYSRVASSEDTLFSYAGPAPGKPRVSAAMAAWNAEAWLPRCIDSILASTVPVEIIIVDDGSDDGTDRVGEWYAAAYANIIYLRLSHKGEPAARNAGLAAASCEWIAYPDADDIVRPSMYERLLDAADASGSDVAFCTYDVSTGKLPRAVILRGNPDGSYVSFDAGRLLRHGMERLYLAAVIKIEKAEIAKAVGFAGDEWFPSGLRSELEVGHSLGVFGSCSKAVFVRFPGYTWDRRRESLSPSSTTVNKKRSAYDLWAAHVSMRLYGCRKALPNSRDELLYFTCRGFAKDAAERAISDRVISLFHEAIRTLSKWYDVELNSFVRADPDTMRFVAAALCDGRKLTRMEKLAKRRSERLSVKGGTAV